MARVALITSLSTGAISSIVRACSIWRTLSSILPWKALLDSVICDSRSTKVASMRRSSSCASSARPLASVCLKITSFRRRSTSSRRRNVSGGAAASRKASVWPLSQLSSMLSSLMFSMISCNSLSSVALISAWSSAANDRRWPKLASRVLMPMTSAAGSRRVCSSLSTCSLKRASSSPSAGRLYSINRAICSINSAVKAGTEAIGATGSGACSCGVPPGSAKPA